MKTQEITLKAIFATMTIFVCLITTSFANPVKGTKSTTQSNIPPSDVHIHRGGIIVIK